MIVRNARRSPSPSAGPVGCARAPGLGSLVHAQRQSVLVRVEVEPYDIPHLLDDLLVAGAARPAGFELARRPAIPRSQKRERHKVMVGRLT